MTFTHNINSVISDVDDVQDDVRSELRKRVGGAMRVMYEDARSYIIQDPNARGRLLNNLSLDERNLVFSINTSLDYAPIVEFGSGSKTNEEYQYGNRIPPEWPSEASSLPVQMPFDEPDIPKNRSHPKFNAFVSHIVDWMKEKGVLPQTGDLYFSATLIAEEIIENGSFAHPFLRPAYYDNQRRVVNAAESALSKVVR